MQTEFDPLFEVAYHRWLEAHIRASKGERKRKLMDGLGYAEKLFLYHSWWLAFGNLDYLHPEYEVQDFKDGTRFIDFSYIRQGVRVAIEVDSYGTHWRDLDRWQFDDHVDRQNDLVIDDWKVLRFTLNKIKNNPRLCQQKLQQALGKWGMERDPVVLDHPIDQAILKLLANRDVACSPTDIARELGWHKSTAAKHLNRLLEDEYVFSVKAGLSRVTRYIINRSRRGSTGQPK